LLNVRFLIWIWQLGVSVIVFWLTVPLKLSFLLHVLFVVLILLTVRSLVIGVYGFVLAASYRDEKLSYRQFFKYWVGETLAFSSLYYFYQLLPRHWLAKEKIVSKNHVILVHGFFCNDGMWFRLRPKLQQAGYSVSTVEMPQAFASVNAFTDLIRQEIVRVQQELPGVNLTVIGFSMGGLATRNLPVGIQEDVNLITLNSPHQGSWLAAIPGFFKAPNGRQMTPGSDWLKQLNERELNFKQAAGIWTTHDTIVIPAKNSIPPFHPLKLRGRGHLHIAIDDKAHRHLIRVLSVMSAS
jgi:pimeloyl-ACP methyl ester carboxylesterase